MIEVSRCTPASVDAVWAVLADGFQYAARVVGAARVRAVATNGLVLAPEFTIRSAPQHPGDDPRAR